MLNAALKAVNDHGKVREHFALKCISIECQKNQNKVFTTANQERENITRSQSDFGVKTSKLPEARENAGDQVVIGFSFEYDWVTK